MANTPLPTKLDEIIWASTAVEPDLKVAPSDSKYNMGWVVELARVDYENFIQNRQDQAIANMVENGVAHWESTITYQRQSTVRSPVDSYVYCAINNGIVGGSDPSVDVSGNWVKQDEFTTDSIAQNIQTFADSSLQNINFDSQTQVLNKDGSNLDENSGSSLVANRDLSNVSAESVDTKLSSSGAATLSVVAQKVNIDVPVVRSVAHDYLSSASDPNVLILNAVANEQLPTAYFNEMTLSFRYPSSFPNNTGAVTVNVDNLGVVALTDFVGDALTEDALRADDHIMAIYDSGSSQFLIRTNESDSAGIYGGFIEHSILVTNSVSNTEETQTIDLSGTPLEHCKTIVVKIVLNDLLSDSTAALSGGVRIIAAPSNQIALLSQTASGETQNITHIPVTANGLELFASVPTFTIGTITVTSEIIGGYR
jgi:hypothetical protein